MLAGVTKITRHFQITIPSYVRKATHLHEGDLLSFETLESGDILVKPVHMVKKTQAYYWTDKWQKGIGESEKAIKQEEFEVFDNVNQAKRSLKHGKKISHS